MYYSFNCPKCGSQLIDFEDGGNAEWNADLKLEELVKDHYAKMHYEGEQLLTDSELLYAIKNGLKSSEEKPY